MDRNTQARRTSPQRWGTTASELLTIESTDGWRKTHASLSFYLSDLAKDQNKTKSMFWRLLAAGHEYNRLRAKLDPGGKEFPALEDPGVKASPESLELVNKISRVAPTHVVEMAQRKAMRGEISRRELRTLWLAYRPVLGGKTARGRIVAPRYDKHNQAMRRALIEANSLALLAQNGPDWLGSGAPYVYKIVHISGDDRLRHLYPMVPAAVVLFADGERDDLQLHGVEAGDRAEDNAMLEQYDPRKSSVDFLWFATPREFGKEDLAKIPREIGILRASANAIRVVRPARAAKSNEDDSKQLLRAILRETTH